MDDLVLVLERVEFDAPLDLGHELNSLAGVVVTGDLVGDNGLEGIGFLGVSGDLEVSIVVETGKVGDGLDSEFLERDVASAQGVVISDDVDFRGGS